MKMNKLMRKILLTTFLICLLPQIADAKTFKTKKWFTKNGAQVVFYQAMEVPMVDVSVAFAAGSAYDGQAYGLAKLTAELLSQGNGPFDANQIAEQLADTGAQFNAETSRDMSILQIKTLTEPQAMDKALNIFSLIINKPNFRSEAFTREKNNQLLAIAQDQQSPDEVATLLFFNKLYQNHPYAHPVDGKPETVQKLMSWQVRDFYKKYFVASNAVIVIVGAINEEQARSISEQVMQDLPKGQAAPKIVKAAPLKNAERITFNFPSSQTVLRVGQLGIDHHTPDYFPLTVGNYILGGASMVSRLALEVREKRGLTYGISSQFMPMPGNGPFLISFSTKNSQAEAASKAMETILSEFLKQEVTQKELSDAKQYLIGSFPLSLASNSSIASMLLKMTFYHLPDDYLDTYTARIEAVTAEDIFRSFKSLINPNQLLHVSVGKHEAGS
jgi:zinc protease